MTEATIAGVSDLLAALDIPGTGGLTLIANKYLEKRRKEAQDLFIDELSDGYHGKVDFDSDDLDPFVSMSLRLMKAVHDGVANDNLRFLAQVMIGLKKFRTFDEDKFVRWARILEGMTRDELLTVGFAYLCTGNIDLGAPESANTYWPDLKRKLERAGFKPLEIEPVCSSVARTGLLTPMSAWGGMTYYPSPWLKELAELVDTAAMRKMKR